MDKMQLQSMKCVNQADLEIIIRTRLQTCKKAILAFFRVHFLSTIYITIPIKDMQVQY